MCALAIDSRDTPLVRDSLTALERTTAAGNLFNEYLDRQPLLDAMQHPDRRVQYDTALILAKAPDTLFAGATGLSRLWRLPCGPAVMSMPS